MATLINIKELYGKRVAGAKCHFKTVFRFFPDDNGYCEKLQSSRKFVIANQLLKSGTSTGANAIEAQNAESKDDFIHKMKVAAKEAEETQYWLMLREYSRDFPACKELAMKLQEIQKVLAKILSTSKRNKNSGH